MALFAFGFVFVDARDDTLCIVAFEEFFDSELNGDGDAMSRDWVNSVED